MTLRNLIESKGFPRTNQSITYILSTNNSHSPTNINRKKEKQELKSHGCEGKKKTRKVKRCNLFLLENYPKPNCETPTLHQKPKTRESPHIYAPNHYSKTRITCIDQI